MEKLFYLVTRISLVQKAYYIDKYNSFLPAHYFSIELDVDRKRTGSVEGWRRLNVEYIGYLCSKYEDNRFSEIGTFTISKNSLTKDDILISNDNKDNYRKEKIKLKNYIEGLKGYLTFLITTPEDFLKNNEQKFLNHYYRLCYRNNIKYNEKTLLSLVEDITKLVYNTHKYIINKVNYKTLLEDYPEELCLNDYPFSQFTQYFSEVSFSSKDCYRRVAQYVQESKQLIKRLGKIVDKKPIILDTGNHCCFVGLTEKVILEVNKSKCELKFNNPLMTMILKIISLYETEMKNSILSEYPTNNPSKSLNHGTIEGNRF